VGTFSEGLADVTLDGKTGFINIAGEIIIPPQYGCARSFAEGLAGVMNKSGRWGFIDTSGRYVIPPEFDSVRSFSEGLAAFMIDDKWGFMDRRGKTVIPARFDGAHEFSEGLAVVEVHIDANPDSGPLYGYVDKTGEMVIAPTFTYAHSFRDGIASVGVGGTFEIKKTANRTTRGWRNRNWTGIDKTGRLLWEPREANPENP
jgi:hypothetical protein